VPSSVIRQSIVSSQKSASPISAGPDAHFAVAAFGIPATHLALIALVGPFIAACCPRRQSRRSSVGPRGKICDYRMLDSPDAVRDDTDRSRCCTHAPGRSHLSRATDPANRAPLARHLARVKSGTCKNRVEKRLGCRCGEDSGFRGCGSAKTRGTHTAGGGAAGCRETGILPGALGR